MDGPQHIEVSYPLLPPLLPVQPSLVRPKRTSKETALAIIECESTCSIYTYCKPYQRRLPFLVRGCSAAPTYEAEHVSPTVAEFIRPTQNIAAYVQKCDVDEVACQRARASTIAHI